MSYHYNDVLTKPTPELWFKVSSDNIQTILLDHAWCERKAAQTAFSLLNKTDDPKVQTKLSKLIREEMRHFEMMLPWLGQYKVKWGHLSPPRYAKALMDNRQSGAESRLLDTLVIASLIEARSCERFAGLVSYLPDDLGSFYHKLMQAEKRHVGVYLDISRMMGFGQREINESLSRQSEFESEVIYQKENVIRFHSGMPDDQLAALGFEQ